MDLSGRLRRIGDVLSSTAHQTQVFSATHPHHSHYRYGASGIGATSDASGSAAGVTADAGAFLASRGLLPTHQQQATRLQTASLLGQHGGRDSLYHAGVEWEGIARDALARSRDADRRDTVKSSVGGTATQHAAGVSDPPPPPPDLRSGDDDARGELLSRSGGGGGPSGGSSSGGNGAHQAAPPLGLDPNGRTRGRRSSVDDAVVTPYHVFTVYGPAWQEVAAKVRDAGAGSIEVTASGGGNGGVSADTSAVVMERDVLNTLHGLLSKLSTQAQKIHDLSVAPPRASLDASVAGLAASSAAAEVGKLRRQVLQEQHDRRVDAETHATRVRDAEERLKTLTSQCTELRQKVSHSEHRVRQREQELDELKDRLRKRQAAYDHPLVVVVPVVSPARVSVVPRCCLVVRCHTLSGLSVVGQ